MRKKKKVFAGSLCIIAIIGLVLFYTGSARAEEQGFNLFSYFNIFKRSPKIEDSKVVKKKKEESKTVVAAAVKKNIKKQKDVEAQKTAKRSAALRIEKKVNSVTKNTKDSVKVAKTKKKAKAKEEKKEKKKTKAKAKKKKVAEKKPAQVFEFDPTDPSNLIYLGGTGVKRSTGDITKSGYASESMRLGAGWHPKAIDAKIIPRDKFGLVNWVQLVNKKAIEPKASLDPDYKEPQPFNLNILFKMKGGFVDNVVFPHDIHTYWLDCVNCHNKIFFQFAGWNNVKMTEIAQGEWCGRCHGRVAFPVTDCTRCHKYPNGHEIEKTATKRKIKPKKKKK
ncbi:MAG: c(7)-type cytochrome triheme domain-containing protein [Thermodesulfobacteriota bacterium]